MTPQELQQSPLSQIEKGRFVRGFLGSTEVIKGTERFCLWIQDKDLTDALEIDFIKARVEQVRLWRENSPRPATRALAEKSHQFCEVKSGRNSVLIVPIRSSENREYLPCAIYDNSKTVNNLAYAIYDPLLLDLAIICSRLHLIWVGAVCGKLETRFSYSNKMGWNTFPIPKLTGKSQSDLKKSAENILLARESHYPKSIADLYSPGAMPDDLQVAHDENDETLERIYIGRRFKNDTERLEKLFEMYTKMTAN